MSNLKLVYMLDTNNPHQFDTGSGADTKNGQIGKKKKIDESERTEAILSEC